MTAGGAPGEAGELARMFRTHEHGHEGLAAAGSALARTCGAPEGQKGWTERGGGGAVAQACRPTGRGVGHTAESGGANPRGLAPPRGRGKRQSTDAVARVEAMAKGLTAQRVSGVLSVAGEKHVEQTTPDVGRGRGSVRRETRVMPPTRSHLTPITRQGETLAALTQRFGWQACVPNAPRTRVSWPAVVLGSRNADRVERLCKRRKSRVHIAPLCVKLNEQSEGLTSLLTLGVRVVTVMAFVLRRSLGPEQAHLPNRHPENTQKSTDRPTAARILQAFAGVSLTSIEHATGEEILRRITPLSGGQEAILQRLGLGTHLSRQLAIQNRGS